ncbi:MAG: ABC transporter ATP-binding protein [Bifidobacteriaceae bacterium]|jgi:ABC-type Fe3+/spermidine/putrescine transport system ATPase subunit|nr:ABC transporter ATP-binding protein [Bifidobacteriaceae bacterium]
MSENELKTGALEVIALRKAFTSDFVAVRDVSFNAKPSEFVTLLGPSGSGKTTILRMIAGLEMPTNGHIILDEVDITDAPATLRPIVMVFQNYALFPHMTVYDNIAYGLKIAHIDKVAIALSVNDALALMDLSAHKTKKPHELSGGEQQRVALARALVTKPKVLLFDEPLSNLDAKLRAKMRIEILKLCNLLKITALYVTHDQDEAFAMSDKIVVINAGKVEQIGTPCEIHDAPSTEFVADFIDKRL